MPVISPGRAVGSCALAALIAASWAVGRAQTPTPPDTIYVNATVLTMDAARPMADAVAVRGETIAAVGTSADLRKTAGPNTRIVDLGNKVLMPGFVDAHSHFPGSGTSALLSVNLNPPPVGSVDSMDRLIAELKAKALVTPKGQWIVARGYDQTLLKEGRHPTRADLDKASTDHPIIITHTSGHLNVANSMALERAGVGKGTPQPPGGVIERDKAGEPTGVMQETDAGIRRLIPPNSAQDDEAAIRWANQDYVSHGVTTATLAGGGLSPAMEKAKKAGVITFRIVAMAGGGGQRNAAVAPAKMVGDEMMKTGQMYKLVHDGSIQGYTGYLKDPYEVPYEGDEHYRGYPRETREELIAKVKALNRAGWQVAIHANGDAAIDDTIEAYQQAMKDQPRPDVRFRIEHAQMSRDDQLDQMRELGITPSFFVSHTYFWGDQHRDIFMGPGRAPHMSPLKSALDRGVRFSIHLDTPVTPMSPLQAVWSAVNRMTRTGKVVGPEQRITPLQALRAVTIDAAWQDHDEKIKGSIETGKFADFVILGANPTTVDPVTIKDIKILETIVGGKTVYAAESGTTAAR